MKIRTNEKGEVVMTETELDDMLKQHAAGTVEEVVKKLKLNEPERPPVNGAADAAPANFLPKAGETLADKRARIQRAGAEVRGGKLRIEDAPKELKTIRFFRALAEKDDVVVKALSVGSAADGGNLVPIEFATDLKVAMEEYGAINDCTQHTMTTGELDLRTVTTKPLIYQVDEGAQVTEAAPKFGKPQLIAKAFAGIQVMSKELFQDNNVGLYDKLIALFAEGFSARKSTELFSGSAVFTGIFNSVTPVTTTLDGPSLENLTYKKLVTMVNSLSPGKLARGGKWYMHRNTFGYVQGLTDNQDRPIVINPWDSQLRMMLGYPVVLDEAMPSTNVADTGYVVFGNLVWVDHGERQDISATVLTEGTVATVNLAEKRSLGLVIDTRWGLVVSLPSYLAILKTKANP